MQKTSSSENKSVAFLPCFLNTEHEETEVWAVRNQIWQMSLHCYSDKQFYSNCYPAHYSDEQWLEEHSSVRLKKKNPDSKLKHYSKKIL